MRHAAIIVLIAWLARACGPSTPPMMIEPSLPVHPVPPSPTSLRFSTAENRVFAEQNVGRLIRIVVLPPGARQVATVPNGASQRFRNEWGRPFRQPGAVTVYRVWIVRQPLKEVVRFIQVNAPPRPRPEVPFRSKTYGVAFRANGSYAFPPIPGRSWSRWLNVGTTALPGGSTVVVAQAGEEWIHTPPKSALLPRGVRRIDVVSRVGDRAANVLVHVRNRVDVGQIVAMTNGLGLANAERVACADVLFGGPTVTLRFRAKTGKLLAVARVSDPLGLGRSGPCNPLQLTIGGRKAPPLIGADLLLRIQRLLDIDLAPPLPRDVASCLRRAGWATQTVTPTELAATRGAHGWTITFHRTGKVTLDRPGPRTLERCVRR